MLWQNENWNYWIGLIGGSIALELKTRSLGSIQVYGADNNPAHVSKIKELKLVDELVSTEQIFSLCDVIILAFPVNAIKNQIIGFLDLVKEHQVIIDTGSTKRFICQAIEGHKNRSNFVAAHPLAGTEFSGPEAAILDLFKGKKNIICEKNKSSESAIDKALKIFDFLGMSSYFLEAEEHDRHLAYVSHLSHISSFTLSLTVQEIERDQKQIFNLASTGFQSTARLAKSNADTWGPIFDANGEYLIEAIDLYINYLNKFRNSIENGNVDASKNLMLKANQISSVLDGIILNKQTAQS